MKNHTDRKNIDLHASITEGGNRRTVSDNLLEWLFLYRKPSGKILPENFRRKRWALCCAMNWKAGGAKGDNTGMPIVRSLS